MITFERVGVSLGGQPILAEIDLTVPEGGWVGLVGPNGAGKSTLIRSLLGEVEHSGAIRLAGGPLPSGRSRARLMASVPQRPFFPAAMNVSDYVLLGRTPHIGYLGAEGPADTEASLRAIEALDLIEYQGRSLGTLSGGEQQRVVLARAFAQEAPLLLLDEPTTALDIGHQLSVLELVDRVRHQRQLTVIAAIHDLTLAAQFCDQLVLLHRGRVAATGTPEQVLTSENLAEFFAARVEIVSNGAGVRAVVPRRN